MCFVFVSVHNVFVSVPRTYTLRRCSLNTLLPTACTFTLMRTRIHSHAQQATEQEQKTADALERHKRRTDLTRTKDKKWWMYVDA